MSALDFFIRCILMAGIYFFIISYIPVAIKDFKQMWHSAFWDSNRKVKKKKAIKVYTGATVYTNSFSQIPQYSDTVILSQE